MSTTRDFSHITRRLREKRPASPPASPQIPDNHMIISTDEYNMLRSSARANNAVCKRYPNSCCNILSLPRELWCSVCTSRHLFQEIYGPFACPAPAIAGHCPSACLSTYPNYTNLPPGNCTANQILPTVVSVPNYTCRHPYY